MKRIRFGLFTPQIGAPFSLIKQRAQLADRLGYDSIWFIDHMWIGGMPEVEVLDAWTVLSATAALTERVRIGTLVLCNSYRNPALLAKMASSLDQVSNGRFILGMGAGWMDEEFRAYGYPFPSARVRIEQLDEALTVIKQLFTEPRASFRGQHYAVEDAVNNPKPIQQPHPPILIGGTGERRLLRVVAQHADIWNCPMHRAFDEGSDVAHDLERKLEVLKRHCDAVGRNFDELEISEHCLMVIGRTETELRGNVEFAKWALGSIFDIDKTAMCGTPDQLIDAIEARIKQGVTFFITMFGDQNRQESLELFAEKVMPAFS